MRLAILLALIACMFEFAPAGRAELSNKDRQAAKKMVEGTLYLRLDAPCRSGRRFGPGTKLEPLLEVSPAGHKLLATPDDSSKSAGNVFWFGPNDALGQATLRYSGERVVLWMEGLPPKDAEAMVAFVQIKTLDDFKAAFDRTFSKAPLQDEHPDWPAEIRKAIAERRVVEGMTKDQAFCVVGQPTKTETGQESGAEVETWYPRQISGAEVTYMRKRKGPPTEFPSVMKFVGGKLTTVQMPSTAPTKK